MKKILTLITTIFIALGCDEVPVQKQNMVLEYAIHYPDEKVVKKHHFIGVENAKAVIKLSGTFKKSNYIDLYRDGVPGIPICVERSMCPLEIISIYNEED